MSDKLKIRVIACCKNEEAILPFFLQYYSSFVDEIVLYDGGSTDKSLEIISSYPKAKVISTGNNDKIDDLFLTKIRNEAYKEGREQWDWQIVVDTDEFVYHPNLLQKLREYKANKIDLPRVAGYQMYSTTFPKYNSDKTIIDQIQTGRRSPIYLNKNVLFDPKTVEIDYSVGCHEYDEGVKYSGYARSPKEIMLLHYRWISYHYFLNKNIYVSNRLSEINIKNGWGGHTIQAAKMSEEEFNIEVRNSYNIFEDNFLERAKAGGQEFQKGYSYVTFLNFSYCRLLDIGARLEPFMNNTNNTIVRKPLCLSGEHLAVEGGLKNIASRSFDAVIALDVLEYVDDPLEFMNELFRISIQGVAISSSNTVSPPQLLKLAQGKQIAMYLLVADDGFVSQVFEEEFLNSKSNHRMLIIKQ